MPDSFPFRLLLVSGRFCKKRVNVDIHAHVGKFSGKHRNLVLNLVLQATTLLKIEIH